MAMTYTLPLYIVCALGQDRTLNHTHNATSTGCGLSPVYTTQVLNVDVQSLTRVAMSLSKLHQEGGGVG